MEKKMKLLAALAALSLAFACVSCSQDGDTIISGAQTHAVVFNIGGGAEISVQTVESGKLATEPAVAEKDGYVFSGWYTDAALTQRFSFETPITENLTLYARYAVKVLVDESENGDGEIDPTTIPTEEGEAVYVVKHYKQELDGNTYTLAKTEGKAGKIGELSAAQVQDFEGFIPAYFSQVTVTENSDGTMTEVVITYNRRVYTVTFVSEETTVAKQVILYGDTGLAPTAPERTGYEFAGWYAADAEDAFDFETPVGASLTLQAHWTLLPVQYRIYYWFENADDDDYRRYVSQTGTGLPDTPTQAVPIEELALPSKTLDSIDLSLYTLQPFEQQTIAADGSTVVNVYYNRNIVTYTFNPDGGLWSDGTTAAQTVSGKSGATIVITAPTRTGYVFNGWSDTASYFGTEDKTVSAQWVAYMTTDVSEAVSTINSASGLVPLIITGTLDEDAITAIRNAIYNNVAIDSVLLDLSQTTGLSAIPEELFQNFTQLTEIILPEGLTEISSRVFNGCSNLVSVRLPSTLMKIGDRAFDDCFLLTSLVIPASVREIVRYAFTTYVTVLQFEDEENWYKTTTYYSDYDAYAASDTAWAERDRARLAEIGKAGAYFYKKTN